MAFKYTLRRLDELTEPSKERGLGITSARLLRRLRKSSDAPDRLEYDGQVANPRKWNTHLEAVRRARQILRRPNGPERVIIRTDIGADFAVRRFEVHEHVPVPDGPGTPQVDQIHAAVLAYCAERDWNVTELGICVDKPGEHGYCNAWDGGVIYEGGQLLPSDEIHRRIVNVATFIRGEGIKNQNGNGGLPVNGVIVMSQYWERGMGETWNHYSGTPHVTHWHVSGWPSRTGWV